MQEKSRRTRAVRKSNTVRKMKESSKALQKIQPKKRPTARKPGGRKGQPRKIYSRNPLAALLGRAGAVFGIIFLIWLIFFFEPPANYPERFGVRSMKLDAETIEMEFYSNNYNGKLLPLDFLLNAAQGAVTAVEEEKTTLRFQDGATVILTEGSRKMEVNGEKKKFKAPVMTVEGLTLIPGELIEEIDPKGASFEEGLGRISLGGKAPEGEYQEFTGKEGYLRLVNQTNTLPAAYAPEDLVEVNSLNSIMAYGTNTKLREEAAQALARMYSENGVKYIMSSGYRDYNTQTRLFNEKVQQYLAQGFSEERAREEAGTIVALPGTSEHQSGLAVDLSIPGVVLTENFKNTEAGQWLAANSYRYGYVLRYTEAQTAITGIIYEPWHFRYIGYPHSEILVKEGIVFDTYMEDLREVHTRFFKAEDGKNYTIWLLPEALYPEKLLYKAGEGAGVSTDNKESVVLTFATGQ